MAKTTLSPTGVPGMPWSFSAKTAAVTTEYLPRIDVYGGRGFARLDVLGANVPRITVDGASSPRLDVFGGGGGGE